MSKRSADQALISADDQSRAEVEAKAMAKEEKKQQSGRPSKRPRRRRYVTPHVWILSVVDEDRTQEGSSVLLFDTRRAAQLYVLVEALHHDTARVLHAFGPLDPISEKVQKASILTSPLLSLWKSEFSAALAMLETATWQQPELDALFDRSKSDPAVIRARMAFLKGLSDADVDVVYQIIQEIFDHDMFPVFRIYKRMLRYVDPFASVEA